MHLIARRTAFVTIGHGELFRGRVVSSTCVSIISHVTFFPRDDRDLLRPGRSSSSACMSQKYNDTVPFFIACKLRMDTLVQCGEGLSEVRFDASRRRDGFSTIDGCSFPSVRFYFYIGTFDRYGDDPEMIKCRKKRAPLKKINEFPNRFHRSGSSGGARALILV